MLVGRELRVEGGEVVGKELLTLCSGKSGYLQQKKNGTGGRMRRRRKKRVMGRREKPTVRVWQ